MGMFSNLFTSYLLHISFILFVATMTWAYAACPSLRNHLWSVFAHRSRHWTMPRVRNAYVGSARFALCHFYFYCSSLRLAKFAWYCSSWSLYIGYCCAKAVSDSLLFSTTWIRRPWTLPRSVFVLSRGRQDGSGLIKRAYSSGTQPKQFSFDLLWLSVYTLFETAFAIVNILRTLFYLEADRT